MDIVEIAAADARPQRRGAPSIHVLDDSPDAVHLGAVEDGRLVGVLSALPVRPDGEADPRWLQLLGPFGERGEALIDALLARARRPVTAWADSPRPGLDPVDDRWQREVEAPPSSRYNARDIVVVDGLAAVRLRPGMYVGATDARGVRHLVEEVVNNALDEHLAGHARRLEVRRGADGSFAVSDDGRGIPTAALGPVCLQLHGGSTWDGHRPHVHLSPHGLGLAVVNALSAWMVVETHRDGQHTQALFGRGQLLQAPLLLGSTDRSGTTIRFRPDPAVFPGASEAKVRSWLARAAALLPGLEVVLDGEALSQPDGLRGWVQRWLDQPSEVELLEADDEVRQVRVARVQGARGPHRMWVNLTPVTEGDCLDALATHHADLLAVDVRHADPRFDGRTRAGLSDPELTVMLLDLLA
jgi:hypothetical protein